ncbi:MAG: RNA-binding cell elongation regulator Jag/EloR [Flexilinea sp.]
MAKTTLEYIAPSSEEAITKGLAELGISRDMVEIEILDSGSKGLFGIGGRQARVRLTVVGAANEPAKVIEPVKEPEAPVVKPMVSVPYAAAEPSEKEDSNAEVINEASLKVSVNVVKELLEKMRIKATVVGKIGTLAEESDQQTIMIDIKGDDLSYLIGRHSETLNALQYITSLIVGRELGHWVPLLIDVQGYRERRERQLRQMASRMADQVTKSGRRISLEPMPGTERRIIHLALRDCKDVYTESVGEEPNRKVVILPKN